MSSVSARAQFYDEIRPLGLTPLWESLHTLVPRTPNTACAPALWRYAELRQRILEAADLISAAEAERRVLVLENPAYRGQSRITNALYAGVQLIRPGEIARAHRHAQSAFRFVLEGKGAFTAVNGERAYMERGDLILTPAWTWHDHGCEGAAETIWLDGLDLPIVAHLGAGFMEPGAAEQQVERRPPGDTLARFGANMRPVAWRPQGGPPLFHYPYARSREALTALLRAGPLDPIDGVKLRYIDPTTGSDPLPTMTTFLQALPAGFAGAPYRSTDATVFVCAEGTGATTIEGDAQTWSTGDVFVVPGWAQHSHAAHEQCILFSFSERAIHERLGLWREERLA